MNRRIAKKPTTKKPGGFERRILAAGKLFYSKVPSRQERALTEFRALVREKAIPPTIRAKIWEHIAWCHKRLGEIKKSVGAWKQAERLDKSYRNAEALERLLAAEAGDAIYRASPSTAMLTSQLQRLRPESRYLLMLGNEARNVAKMLTRHPAAQKETPVRANDMILHIDGLDVFYFAQRIPLNFKEREFLVHLAKHPDKSLISVDVREAVWPEAESLKNVSVTKSRIVAKFMRACKGIPTTRRSMAKALASSLIESTKSGSLRLNLKPNQVLLT